MMLKLEKTYTIELTIQEGNDEFWEGLQNKIGADEVVAAITDLLADGGWCGPGGEGAMITLTKFEHRARI